MPTPSSLWSTSGCAFVPRRVFMVASERVWESVWLGQFFSCKTIFLRKRKCSIKTPNQHHKCSKRIRQDQALKPYGISVRSEIFEISHKIPAVLENGSDNHHSILTTLATCEPITTSNNNKIAKSKILRGRLATSLVLSAAPLQHKTETES